LDFYSASSLKQQSAGRHVAQHYHCTEVGILNSVNNNKKKYQTVETIPKSSIKIVERGKIDTPNTQLHDCSLSWLGIGTVKKRCQG
jgi:hypothetical protein